MHAIYQHRTDNEVPRRLPVVVDDGDDRAANLSRSARTLRVTGTRFQGSPLRTRAMKKQRMRVPTKRQTHRAVIYRRDSLNVRSVISQRQSRCVLRGFRKIKSIALRMSTIFGKEDSKSHLLLVEYSRKRDKGKFQFSQTMMKRQSAVNAVSV